MRCVREPWLGALLKLRVGPLRHHDKTRRWDPALAWPTSLLGRGSRADRHGRKWGIVPLCPRGQGPGQGSTLNKMDCSWMASREMQCEQFLRHPKCSELRRTAPSVGVGWDVVPECRYG